MAGRDLDGITFWLAEISAKWCYFMHFVLDFLPLDALEEDSKDNLQI